MRRGSVQAACCAIFVALAPAPAHALGLAQLRAQLARYADRLGPASGVYVRDLDSGRTLFSRRADVPRAPASNQKLLVTAAALLRLGPAARLQTRLVTAAPVADGVVEGDVALVGGGDPYLGRAQLRLLAGQLVALGVDRIAGRVLGDGSLLDRRHGSFDSGWAYDRDLGGRLGGLVVDEGRGRDPALHAAAAMRRALLAADVVVDGRAASGRLASAQTTLAAAPSPPLRAIVARINLPSDNFAAELLLKDLGALYGGAGSTPAGAAVTRATLSPLGVRARIVDGSGLSRSDRVTPRVLVTLLARMAERPEGAALRPSLPVAGRSGTLTDRMRRSTARGRCQAKTGSLIGVSALSGYCTTTGAATVAFSLLSNGVCGLCAKRVEDRAVAAIARYDGG